MSAESRRSGAPERADISFAATVKATELYFEQAPEVRVVFNGEPDHESSSGSDRVNLPDQVQERVTYRNVRVDYTLASKLVEPSRGSDDLLP